MIDERLINALDDCIDRLAAGMTIADCLRAYPEYADQLAPLLEAGRIGLRARATAAEVAAVQARVQTRFDRALDAPLPQRALPFRRLASLAAAFMLVIGLALGGVVSAAQSSLPGDWLYDVKRWSESVQLTFSGGGDDLRAAFAQRRIDEVHDLLDLHRAVEVTFEGELTQMRPDNLMIAGLTLTHDANTQGIDGLQPGSRVQVRAMTTTGGDLIALAIQPLDTAEIPVIPSATPTATNTPSTTVTPSLTPTATPSATVTPSHTTTVTPSSTVTAVPSHTPISRSTQASHTPTVPESEACTTAPPDGWVAYQVQTGDTLSGLIAGSGVPLDEVIQVNCIENPRLILNGALIYLPRAPLRITPPGQTPTSGGDDRGANGIAVTPGSGQDNHGSDSGSDDSGGSGDGAHDDDGGDDHGGDDGDGRGR